MCRELFYFIRDCSRLNPSGKVSSEKLLVNTNLCKAWNSFISSQEGFSHIIAFDFNLLVLHV